MAEDLLDGILDPLPEEPPPEAKKPKRESRKAAEKEMKLREGAVAKMQLADKGEPPQAETEEADEGADERLERVAALKAKIKAYRESKHFAPLLQGYDFKAALRKKSPKEL